MSSLSHVQGNAAGLRLLRTLPATPRDRQGLRVAPKKNERGAPTLRVATGKTRRATKPPTRAYVHRSSRSLNRTTDRSDYAGGRGAAGLQLAPVPYHLATTTAVIAHVIRIAREHCEIRGIVVRTVSVVVVDNVPRI